ncbi:hypothetical protein FCL47_15055 [Desulfopila sp. IMCC35006]|uniref:hypothetical protein n=1 Tax=Desulfopila sp. IMCC35006 TaxID=2569542 RepID=UPI0010AB9FD4|nr:hypothetical protein [Desulfopila sp. IMCC35006]TKB25365.1 hypothetical protein FCL47_15055 [Desulfopila sp. IMCC35006]
MNCDKCGITVASGDERNHQNQTFCEDCYMIALSPMKTCDPWAVHSAKNFEKCTGETKHLTEVQSEILRILKMEGSLEPVALLDKLGGSMHIDELHREFSTLRHMEKVKGEKQGQNVLWRLW